MQIICPISGISLIKCDYLLGEDYSDVAPIFRKSRSKLLTDKTAYNFMSAKSETEKKLWFLAVVNCTDLVTFEVPGMPSLQTCERNFYQAFKLAAWMDYASFSIAKDVSFPRFVVRKFNQNMENIYVWLTAIETIREEFLAKDANKERQFRLNKRNQEIQRELTNAVLRDRMFTPSLVNWLFEQAGIEEHPRASLYKRILLTEIKDAWSIDLELLQEINDVISDTFGHNHPMAAPIYGQLHQMKLKRAEGFKEWEILDAEWSSIKDGEVVSERLPIADVYMHRIMADYGHSNKPEKKDFPTTASFYVALSKWNLAQDAISKQKESKIEETEDVIEGEVKEHFNELDGLQDEVADSPDEDEDADENQTGDENENI